MHFDSVRILDQAKLIMEKEGFLMDGPASLIIHFQEYAFCLINQYWISLWNQRSVCILLRINAIRNRNLGNPNILETFLVYVNHGCIFF